MMIKLRLAVTQYRDIVVAHVREQKGVPYEHDTLFHGTEMDIVSGFNFQLYSHVITLGSNNTSSVAMIPHEDQTGEYKAKLENTLREWVASQVIHYEVGQWYIFDNDALIMYTDKWVFIRGSDANFCFRGACDVRSKNGYVVHEFLTDKLAREALLTVLMHNHKACLSKERNGKWDVYTIRVGDKTDED